MPCHAPTCESIVLEACHCFEGRVLSDTLETLQATFRMEPTWQLRQLCRERTTVTCVRMALFCSNLLSTKSSQTTRDFQLYVVLQQISWRFLFIGNAGLPTVCFFCTTVHSKFSRTCWDAERKLRQFCEAFGRSQERIYPKFPYDLIAIEVHPDFTDVLASYPNISQYIPMKFFVFVA